MRFIFITALVVLFLASCDENRIFEFNKDFDDRTWKVTDTVIFDFRITNLQDHYNIYYNVRNSINYPYARLFVNYSLTDSAGNELAKKLDMQDLFDQKTGKPKGTSGLGDIYDHRFSLLSNYEFNKTGKYFLKLEQFMRQDTLPGILSVGVRIEKTLTNQ